MVKKKEVTVKKAKKVAVKKTKNKIKEVTITKVLVTPEMAKKMLEKNLKNRFVDEHHVDFLCSEMDTCWADNGDTIRFNERGELIDGQHRLLATIKREKPVWFWIAKNVIDDDRFSIDAGKPRSLSDHFAMCGEKYHTNKASMARVLWRYHKKTFHLDSGFLNHNAPRPSVKLLYEFYKRNGKRADKWVKYVMCIKEFRDFNRTNMALALFLLDVEFGQEKTDVFLEKMRHGGDYKHSPTHMLPKHIRARKLQDYARYRWEDTTCIIHSFELWLLRKTLPRIDIKEMKKKTPMLYAIYKLK